MGYLSFFFLEVHNIHSSQKEHQLCKEGILFLNIASDYDNNNGSSSYVLDLLIKTLYIQDFLFRCSSRTACFDTRVHKISSWNCVIGA